MLWLISRHSDWRGENTLGLETSKSWQPRVVGQNVSDRSGDHPWTSTVPEMVRAMWISKLTLFSGLISVTLRFQFPSILVEQIVEALAFGVAEGSLLAYTNLVTIKTANTGPSYTLVFKEEASELTCAHYKRKLLEKTLEIYHFLKIEGMRTATTISTCAQPAP